MLKFMSILGIVISALFTLLYFYQIVYAVVAVIHKRKLNRLPSAKKLHSFGIIISARNEEAVIGQLIESVKQQNYPSDLVKIFVVADNCTDRTAQVARKAGAIVYERFNRELVGKGYALDYLFKKLLQLGDRVCDAFLILDADNLLEENYLSEMNKTFDQGYKIVTGYRNSKNYDSNWISAGYSLWFMRESEYLNYPRMLFGVSCAVSGTGFMVAEEIIRKNYGWKHFLLTEDIEFTIDTVISGQKVGYSQNAMLYDEQPTTFRQSWRQRLRWSKGYLQVFQRYGTRLLGGVLRGNFSCFDMSMAIMPAFVLSTVSIASNLALAVWGVWTGGSILIALQSLGQMLLSMYLTLFVIGAITTVTERRHIHTGRARRVLYALTFPLFMFTYLPISLAALFSKGEWKPIEHRVSAASLRGSGRSELLPF